MDNMENLENVQNVERRSFNDVLKEKEARQALEQNQVDDDGHIALDDAKRIKVLSPGQLVFKRFIRNKLAIFGTVVIVIMFLFSFLGPVFYKYKETETFFKWEEQYKPLTVSTIRTDYVLEISKEKLEEMDRKVKNMVTSTVNKIEDENYELDFALIDGNESQYVLTKIADKTFSLAPNMGGLVANAAKNLQIATYDTVKGIEYIGNDMGEEFDALLTELIGSMTKRDKAKDFEFNGVDYKIERENALSLKIFCTELSVTYPGEKYDSAFEGKISEALEGGKTYFEYGENEFLISKDKGINHIYSVIPGEDEILCTTMVYSGMHSDNSEFKRELFHNINNGEFTFEDHLYTIKGGLTQDKIFYDYTIVDDQGEEIGLLSDFVTRNPDGNDLEIRIKTADGTGDLLEEATLQNLELIRDKVLYIIRNNIVIEEVPEEEETTEETEAEPGMDDDSIPQEEEKEDEKKGLPITLLFPSQVGGFDGVKPVISLDKDENGEPLLKEITGYVTQKISTTSLAGVTQEYKYYYVHCDQWFYLMDTNADPSSRHFLGTDPDAYDVLARIMYGGRISLLVGFIVVFIETILGVIMGGIAGYFGGWVDNLIMRLVDIFYCIPSMPILIILGAFMDDQGLKPIPRLIWMMAILGFLGWAGIARLVRGQILSLREQEFMVATEATGIKVSRRIFRHLIPNVMPQLIVSATAGLGGVILTESTLSFLGLGVKRPMATWGTIINAVTSSNENILNFTHIWIPVGLLICLTVIAFNFVGDGLRDAFDPKMKR